MRNGIANNFDNPKAVLVFNRFKILAAMFTSYNECERITGIRHSLITRVCSGERIHSRGLYFRDLKDDVSIESSDMGKLTLLEYDRDVLGENRQVLANGKRNSPIMYESDMKSLNVYPQ